MKKFLLGLSAFILPNIIYMGICISSFFDIDFLYMIILLLFIVFEVLYIPVEKILKQKFSFSTEEYNTCTFIGGFLSLLFPIMFFNIMTNDDINFKTIDARGVVFTTFFAGVFVVAWIGTIIVIRLIYEAVIRTKNRNK